ncbi:hypothetical protein IE077_002295 [Cardiosporidium cionae]|uniref:Uncharacterized protein n=1 Tax=Cardiosporidium cionae TaxID=476202 RepID=A0ABQ7J4Q4_9APIC|nr:hypothetical protein IE077_002295 [Cardiosporidium cionae]|eukprot:KAF8818026.1 hypothetical protein IE077_002295 [Cardiosporidium cionae]
MLKRILSFVSAIPLFYYSLVVFTINSIHVSDAFQSFCCWDELEPNNRQVELGIRKYLEQLPQYSRRNTSLFLLVGINLNLLQFGMEAKSSPTCWNESSEPLYQKSARYRIQKLQYISESYTPNRYDVCKSFLRKNTENYALIPQKNCILMPGPKRNKYENPPGLVVAYNSGYIVSVGNRPETVGIGTPSEGSIPYADWVRKKFRSHKSEPTCSSLKNTRLLNVLGRVDIPAQQELFLEELHDFLLANFPQWKVIYDPEISPFLVLCRLWTSKKEDQIREYIQSMRSPSSRTVSYSTPFEGPSPRSEAVSTQAIFTESRPLLIEGKFRWPSAEEIHKFQEEDKEWQSKSPIPNFLNCILVIGAKHIVAHKIDTKEELELAINDIFPILRYFIDFSDKRWYN